MWPYPTRSNRDQSKAPAPQGFPPFHAFKVNDAVVKVWLPQKLTDRINWLSQTLEVSRPDAIRALLFEHLYGRAAYEAFKAYAAKEKSDELLALARKKAKADRWSGLDIGAALHGVADRNVDDIKLSPQRSSRADWEHLGQFTDDFTLYLPSLLKQGLQSIAEQYGLTPSSYVRKMLVQQLLGEPAHTAWRTAVGKINPDIVLLEQGG